MFKASIERALKKESRADVLPARYGDQLFGNNRQVMLLM